MKHITPLFPSTLRRPANTPKLVYLDLNHWISLSKALCGHRDGGRYKHVLEACIKAVETGSVVFPLSDSLYVEILKIRKYNQRRDLRDVIEKVAKYKAVISRATIVRHEVEAVLNRLVGPNPNPIKPTDYIVYGALRTWDFSDRLRVRSRDGRDVTSEVREQFPEGPKAFDQIISMAMLEFNRQFIEGPHPDEELEFRKEGWNPNIVLEVHEKMAQDELVQVERFNRFPEWRGDRIRHVIAAREVILIDDILMRSCNDRGNRTLKDLFPTYGSARGVFDIMPSFDVAVTLKASYHQNAKHSWTHNDIHDINAMASTIPYCDIVVMDKEVLSHVNRTGLADRMNTNAIARLSDLCKFL